AGNATATLDFELFILDGPGDEAGRTNQKAPAHRELTLETPADVGALNRGRAAEEPALGDRNVAALLDIGFDRAFDDQSVAAGNLARQDDLASDHQRSGTRVGCGQWLSTAFELTFVGWAGRLRNSCCFWGRRWRFRWNR